jgi:pyridoxamine 5'-phosphate oxidase
LKYDSKDCRYQEKLFQEKLSEAKANPDPVKQFAKWWKQAIKSNLEEANAMTLATASPDGLPSARIVLLKDFKEKRIYFFYNYNSFKGQQLSEKSKSMSSFFLEGTGKTGSHYRPGRKNK